jgi:hypothetical protein
VSDNPTGADNQQESLSPAWVVGFVDGEGCFFVGINRQPTMRVGWQVLPEFRVVQHERDVAILERLREFFGCGQVTVNHGDRRELRIRGLRELSQPYEQVRPVDLTAFPGARRRCLAARET